MVPQTIHSTARISEEPYLSLAVNNRLSILLRETCLQKASRKFHRRPIRESIEEHGAPIDGAG